MRDIRDASDAPDAPQHSAQSGHASQHASGHSSHASRQVAPAGHTSPQHTLPLGHSSHGQQHPPAGHSSQQHPSVIAAGRGALEPSVPAMPKTVGIVHSDQAVATVINVVNMKTLLSRGRPLAGGAESSDAAAST